jgi:ABC-type transport system involved in cytochrome bd biosynthesis fused ATPase/permease subunit
VVGFIQGGGAVIVVSLIVVGLGVIEVTAREHFSGYRSHTILLALVPAVAIVAAAVSIFGAPQQRGLVLLFVAPVFLVLFWLLRRKFMTARQARIARPPSPRA